MFSYLLTAPSLEKRYKVYCKTPFFREELSGYAMMLGETSKDELLDMTLIHISETTRLQSFS